VRCVVHSTKRLCHQFSRLRLLAGPSRTLNQLIPHPRFLQRKWIPNIFYKNKTKTAASAANSVKYRYPPLVSKGNSACLHTISKMERSKARFISRLSHGVAFSNTETDLQEQISPKELVRTRCKTKFNTTNISTFSCFGCGRWVSSHKQFWYLSSWLSYCFLLWYTHA
jgi:hypothetical protein